MREKFAAKFTEAGNLKLQEVSQFPTSPLRAAALTSIVFHSIFPQAAQSCRLSGVLFNFCVFQQPAKSSRCCFFQRDLQLFCGAGELGSGKSRLNSEHKRVISARCRSRSRTNSNP